MVCRKVVVDWLRASAGLAVVAIGVFFLSFSAVASSNLTVAWNQSSLTNVAGYKLYYGTASHAYSNSVVAGNTTTATITGIIPGKTYYFAASTYDAAGTESALSSEISYTVPQAVTLVTPAFSKNTFSFQVTNNTGLPYEILVSTDLVNWAILCTNTAPFTLVDTNKAAYKVRIFRAVTLQ